MRTLGTLAVGLLLLTGCATPQGRFSAIDIDFRKPDQIQAGAREAEAPYKDWQAQTSTATAEDKVKTEGLPLSWWQILFDMIKSLEVRVTVVKVEWSTNGACK